MLKNKEYKLYRYSSCDNKILEGIFLCKTKTDKSWVLEKIKDGREEVEENISIDRFKIGHKLSNKNTVLREFDTQYVLYYLQDGKPIWFEKC